MNQWGFRCHFASNIHESSYLLTVQPVDLVLSETHLSDGSGIGLMEDLVGMPITAFLCWPVDNGCYWLPAINDGKTCIGLAALRRSEFASTLQKMVQQLSHPLASQMDTPQDTYAQLLVKTRSTQRFTNTDSFPSKDLRKAPPCAAVPIADK